MRIYVMQESAAESGPWLDAFLILLVVNVVMVGSS